MVSPMPWTPGQPQLPTRFPVLSALTKCPAEAAIGPAVLARGINVLETTGPSSSRKRDFEEIERRTFRSICPLTALSGHRLVRRTCPLLGVKRTSQLHCEMSANDPKRTF